MAEGDDFYVGYLVLPWSHSRFLRVAIPAMLTLMAVVNVLIHAASRDPGSGVWDSSNERTWVGTLVVEPCPILLAEGESGGPSLVVELGKRGAAARLAPFAGRRVELRGYELAREGRRLIELAPRDDAVVDLGPAPAPTLGAMGLRDLGEVRVSGEVLDAKCYLGAMKPGDGVGHRACARLCILGGIPAMVRTGVDPREYLVLASDGLGGVGPEVADLAGGVSTLRGRLWALDGLRILELARGED